MYKAVIIEDEKSSARLLRSMLGDLFSDIEVVEISHTVKDGIESINKQKPDLVFLDINVGTDSGFEVLKSTNDADYEVIIITAHKEYAISAIQNAAAYFILKPFDFDELKEAVDRAKKQLELKNSANSRSAAKKLGKVSVGTTDGVVFVSIENLVYIEACSSYSEFNMVDEKKHVASKSLAYYEDLLAQYTFFRVHKSFIVNLTHINKYERGKGGSLIMSNGDRVPVARDKKHHLLELLGA